MRATTLLVVPRAIVTASFGLRAFLQRGAGKRHHRRRLHRRWNADVCPAAELLEDRTLLSLFVVNSVADGAPAVDGQLTLREAITAANTNAASGDASAGDADGDQIVFNIATADPTIVLSLGQLSITDDLQIDGTNTNAAGGRVTIDGNGASRVFAVIAAGSAGSDDDVSFSNLTITGGSTSQGGAMRINSGNIVTITESTITANHASQGGGIYVDVNAALTIEKSTVSGNTASQFGGGIFNFGSFGNVGTVTIINSTISGNSANQDGGGIYNNGTLNVDNSTIADNRADSDGTGDGTGGGIRNGGTAILTNTIVADNVHGADTDETADDIAGTANVDTTNSSHNLIGDADTAGGLTNGTNGNIVGADPLLGDLADNGGPTFTHALLEGSPAIDAGDNTGAPDTDQRGFDRVVDGDDDGTATIDIGAFEVQVEPENQAPTLVMEISDVTVAEDADDLILNLDDFFSDPDVGDVLSFEVSNGNTDLVSTTISGSQLTLDFLLNQNGQTEITVTATDAGGLQVSDTFLVTVLSPQQQAAAIQQQVNTLVTSGVVNKGQGNALFVKMNLKGNGGDIGRVQGFINQVNALLQAGILTEEQANLLLNAADSLLMSLLIH